MRQCNVQSAISHVTVVTGDLAAVSSKPLTTTTMSVSSQSFFLRTFDGSCQGFVEEFQLYVQPKIVSSFAQKIPWQHLFASSFGGLVFNSAALGTSSAPVQLPVAPYVLARLPEVLSIITLLTADL
ncbi:hypothetical protein AOLI_G00297960 [Acnodon oligacanthus]